MRYVKLVNSFYISIILGINFFVLLGEYFIMIVSIYFLYGLIFFLCLLMFCSLDYLLRLSNMIDVMGLVYWF